MNTFWKIFAWLIIGFIFGTIVVVSYWLLYPYNPIEFKTSKFKVLTPIVKQGSTLRLESNYCKYLSLSAVVGREFVNGLIFAVPESTTNRDVGCFKIEFGVPIPRELPVGEYYLKNIYKYQVNPIREVIVKQSSEQFEVIE